VFRRLPLRPLSKKKQPTFRPVFRRLANFMMKPDPFAGSDADVRASFARICCPRGKVGKMLTPNDKPLRAPKAVCAFVHPFSPLPQPSTKEVDFGMVLLLLTPPNWSEWIGDYRVELLSNKEKGRATIGMLLRRTLLWQVWKPSSKAGGSRL
jgi:hypothetical protein